MRGNEFRRDRQAWQGQQLRQANRRFRDYRLQLQIDQAMRQAEERAAREAEERLAQVTLALQQQQEQQREAQRRAEELERLRAEIRKKVDTALKKRALQEKEDRYNAEVGELDDLRRDTELLIAESATLAATVNLLHAFMQGSATVFFADLTNYRNEIGVIAAWAQGFKGAIAGVLQRVRLVPLAEVETRLSAEMVVLRGQTPTLVAHRARLTVIRLDVTARGAAFERMRLLAATYTNLGLTRAVLEDPRCIIHHILPNEAARLNLRLSGHPVLQWGVVTMPGSRPNLQHTQKLVPQTLQGFPVTPSGEVVHDWIWEYKGHGQSARDMLKLLTPILARARLVLNKMDWGTFIYTNSGNKLVVTHGNLTLNIVFDAAETTLITFYSTAS